MSLEEAQVSIDRAYDRLAAIALGRLYWSEEQLLGSDVNAILVGYAEHLDFITSIFGGGQNSRPPVGRDGRPIKLTPKVFDAVFGGVSAAQRRRRY